MCKDAMKNAAEIRAEEATHKLFFRPANELKEAAKRIIRDAYIAGYEAGCAASNTNDTFIERTTL